MDQERAPGWHPDPRGTGRQRHWDGQRWNGLSATTAPGTGRSPASPLPEDPSPGGRKPRVVWAVTAAVLVALAIGLSLTVLGADDPASDRGPTTTSASTAADEGPSGDAPSPDAPPVAPMGDRTGGSTVAPPNSSEPTTESSPPVPAPDAGCSVPAADLLASLRAHPPLAPFEAELTVSEPRCTGDWATTIVATPSTDSALAVFRRSGDTWSVLLVGSAEPCSGLGIPPEHQALLGCDFR